MATPAHTHRKGYAKWIDLYTPAQTKAVGRSTSVMLSLHKSPALVAHQQRKELQQSRKSEKLWSMLANGTVEAITLLLLGVFWYEVFMLMIA